MPLWLTFEENHGSPRKTEVPVPGKPSRMPCLGKSTQEPLPYMYVSWNQPGLVRVSDLLKLTSGELEI